MQNLAIKTLLKFFDNISLHMRAHEKVYTLLFVAMAVTILSATPSAAQDFGSITNFLDAVVKALTGALGIACATIAVVAVGIIFMMGRMDWMHAISVLLGIAFMFGGAALVASMSTLGTTTPTP